MSGQDGNLAQNLGFQGFGDKVGFCAKNLNREVVSLNGVCQKICGGMVGKVCEKGCMLAYPQVEECAELSEGMTYHKNILIDAHKVDAVIVNDGERILTMIYPLEDDQAKLRKQEIYLRERGLTRSEVRIMQMVLLGHTNAQIAEQLFISKATLKTHLNNIYKKLPAGFRQMKVR
ncbi:HTH-type transcriptional regulator MalT [compost metagenome]